MDNRSSKSVKLTPVEREALRGVIRETHQAVRNLNKRQAVQEEVVTELLRAYGFSDEATMDLSRLDFDGVVTINEPEITNDSIQGG